MKDPLAAAIEKLAVAHKEGCEAIAKPLHEIASHLKYLGNGDAATKMGAIENLAHQLSEGASSISEGLRLIAESHDP